MVSDPRSERIRLLDEGAPTVTRAARPRRTKPAKVSAETQRFTYLYSATVLGLALCLLIYVGQYMEMVELQIQISSSQSQGRKLEAKIERLVVRKAELARLERLEFAAQERLGLILPGQGNVRYLPVMDGHGEQAIP